MTVFAIGMVRDEADVIDITMRHALAHVDHLIVLDNGSVDGTRDILEQLERTTVIDDPEVGYYQSRKMTHLAELAGEHGADWAVPVDADELWAAGPGRIGDILDSIDADEIDVVEADFYHHCVTLDDPTEGTFVERMGWRNRTYNISKVAVRCAPGLVIAQGNHSATYFDRPARVWERRMLVHHYPYRSLEQFIRKARNGAEAYAAAPDLPEQFGWHWRDYGALSDEDAAAQFGAFVVAHPADDDKLLFDPPEVWS